jgi:inorganic triphosphatase YgiF
MVEVALDLGHIDAGGKSAPICELELELKAGQTSALFDIARELARTLAILPAHLSKAERGYRLAQGNQDLPQTAQHLGLSPNLTRPELAQHLLRAMFLQFTSNLNTLQTSDDPEVVHQARVGWRRFKSGLKLFSKVLANTPPPSLEALKPLLSGLGQLRNLDVARHETLPPAAAAYAMGNAQRAQSWQELMLALTQAGERQRQAVRQALQAPPLGACLLAVSEWLEQLAASGDNRQVHKGALQKWVRQRMLRLEEQLERAEKDANSAEEWHRVRILAKRLRYGTQALRELLPGRLAGRYYQHATGLQTGIGARRDIAQALELVARLAPRSGVLEFLRGFAAGSTSGEVLTGLSPA